VISRRLAPASLALLGLGWLLGVTGCVSTARRGPSVPPPPTPAEQEMMRQIAELEGSVLRLEEQVRRLNAELGGRLEDVQEQVSTVNSKLSAQERLLSRAAAAMSAFGLTAAGPEAGPGVARLPATGPDEPAGPGDLPAAEAAAGDADAQVPAAAVGIGDGQAVEARSPEAREPMDLDELRRSGEAGALIPEPPEEGQRLYETAYRDLQRENFQLALINFRSFLADYPQTRLSDNAQYWIGEAYYAQGQFNQAIEEFRKVIDDYPGQDKVPGAHYKIALCFINLRDTVTARRYLTYVIEHYPGTREARLAEERLATL